MDLLFFCVSQMTNTKEGCVDMQAGSSIIRCEKMLSTFHATLAGAHVRLVDAPSADD